jgi:O-acetyl-ADP-ribose deacetylase (regulator of RNase III)
MKTSVGKTVIEIASGDITELEIDAIASAANSGLRMVAGVAGAIKRAGGEAIETEAMLQGPIEVGQAVATTGHGLKARWVIHAAVTGGGRTPDADIIAKATYSALACAERCHARAIALPAFGTGGGGCPLYQCASIMTAEVVRYLKARPGTGLRRVMLSVYDEAAKAAFTNALAGVSRF